MGPLRFQNRIIWQYAILTYLLLLLNGVGFLREIEYVGRLTPFFVGAVYLTYSLMYLLPALLIVLAMNRLLFAGRFSQNLPLSLTARSWIIYVLAVVLFSALQVLVYMDRFVYHLYGFHLDNSFVRNLIMTPGGMDSMGTSNSTQLTFAIIFTVIFAIQAVLLMLVLNVRQVRSALSPFCRKRAIVTSAIAALGLAGFERVAYGWSNLTNFAPVLAASTAFPLYMPLTFNSLGKRLGYKVDRDPAMKVNMESARLQYPLKPLQREPAAKPLNIVWLVSESLRYDMLDPKIMPAAHQFAQRSQWFRKHYSGGNGTRMGMFSMFYGLYGNYWFPFLAERRGPVLIDTLLDMNYQMMMFTSAKFSYPEFDKTIFARMPSDRLHEGTLQPKWRRDIENVDQLLDFIDKRDPTRPFMTFMFFDGPHANYYFPKEAAIATPYSEDLNYATMDVSKDIQLIKNRYINACHQLDTQWARILQYLESHQLLDSTIVLLTGDHGEEFMEKGRWGHNSEFTEEQTRPPFVLWVPGHAPREVTSMTSHLDIPATILPLLGVKNPAQDYSLGFDLLSQPSRDFTIVCDWSNVGFIGQEYKAVFPMKGYQIGRQKITTQSDASVTDRAAFYNKNKDDVTRVMKDLTRFTK